MKKMSGMYRTSLTEGACEPDLLDVLVGTLDRSKLSEKQLFAITAFREQLGEVRALKSAGRPLADGDLSKPAAKLVSAALPE